MKYFSFLIWMLLFFAGDTLNAQNYQPVDKSSGVKVIVKNSGMDIDGKLTGLEGSIHFNPADLKTSVFSVSVDAASINTGLDVRDENLRGEEYLDAKKNPRISFVSKQITHNGSKYLAKGTLTIKGISKEVIIPFTAVPKGDGLLFAGECRINRIDFKIGVGSVVLSDGMTILLSVFAKKI